MRPPPPDTLRLTRRELRVLGLLVEGIGNAAVAAAPGVPVRTAIGHVERVMSKIGAGSRTAAAVRADRQGLCIPAGPA